MQSRILAQCRAAQCSSVEPHGNIPVQGHSAVSEVQGRIPAQLPSPDQQFISAVYNRGWSSITAQNLRAAFKCNIIVQHHSAASQCSIQAQLTRVVLGQAVAQLGVPSPNWGAERDAVNSTEAVETQNEVRTVVCSCAELGGVAPRCWFGVIHCTWF